MALSPSLRIFTVEGPIGMHPNLNLTLNRKFSTEYTQI
jgi:hypothetical protein